MGKIDDCIKEEKDRKWAQEKLEEAKKLIKLGPVAFGEYHNSPIARAIIWDLMDTGQVKRLFTEQPNPQQTNGLTVEENLQTLATPGLDSEGNVQYSRKGQTEGSMSGVIEDRYKTLELINKSMGRPALAITYRDLMQHAVRHGILVYCYDVEIDPVRDEKGRRPSKLNSEQVLAMRNEHMASTFLHTPNKTESGTVLLGGSDHFNHALSKEPNLLERMAIPETQYIECN